MQEVYLGIGSNLGERREELRIVTAFLRKLGSIEKQSPIYETPALEMEDAPPFLNAVYLLKTNMEPKALLDRFEQYDLERGRDRSGRSYQSRPIDIDILLYDRYQFHTPALCIPHAKMMERKFVLQPLADIASDLMIPGSTLSVREALSACPDDSELVCQS